MSSTRIVSVISCLLSVVFISCSSQKADYEEVQKLQDAAEQVFQRTVDYDVKIKACDDAINVLQTFLTKHKEGEWSNIAKSALDSWQSRKSAVQQESGTLMESLYSQLKQRAIDETQKAHPASRIENIVLANRVSNKEGSKMAINDIYHVRMKGTILGTHIFKLTVRVSGHVVMDSKAIIVDEKVIVEE